MPIVIAGVHPESGRLQDVLDVYRETAPLIHEEHGCELFAVHTDGASVFIVERWSTLEDLKAHGRGPVFARIKDVIAGAVQRPSEIRVVENVPLGVPAKGTIQ